ncbi:tandem-95 repeat protein [Gallaecimonas sp. GXIMD4217]|uniref:Ig-like domain-containing protein n=1 Tax=Gallaecimonas sp. GXIMD4217 TaxID=3131927 RepID=UPI00311AF465
MQIVNDESNFGFILVNLDNIDVDTAISNAAPTIGNLGGDSFTYTEGDAATLIDQGGNATVSDGDSADFDGGNLTATILANGDATEDLIGLDTSGAVALAGNTAGSNVSVDGTVVGTLGNNIATGNDLVVNFNANATPTNVQTLVRAITYENTDTDAPSTEIRSLTVTVNDGDGGTSSSATVSIYVQGDNDAPVIGNLDGDSVSYLEGDGATRLDQGAAATVTDVDSGTFSGGALIATISSGEDAAEDLLSLDTSGGVDVPSTNAGTLVAVDGVLVATLGNNITEGNDLTLILNANATPARVQALVQAMTYENTDTLSPTSGARNVRITVSDGAGGTSSNNDVTVTVGAVNDAPSAANNTLYPNEGQVLTLATADFGYADVEGDPLSHVTVVTIPAAGTLWLDVNDSGDLDGSDTLIGNGGTIAKSHLDAGRFKYSPSGSTSSGFTFSVNDGAADSSNYSLTLTVNAQPTVTLNQAGGQADPTNNAVVTFEVVFSESVTGFDGSDIALGGAVTATVTNVSGSGTSYTVTATVSSGEGALTAAVNADGAQDAGGAGNKASTSSDNSVYFDATPPSGYSVAIDQALIDADNETALSFVISGGISGDDYEYSISDGSASLSGSGTLTGSPHSVTGVDVSTLAEGTLTLSLVLSDALDNAGATVTDTVLKQYNTTPVISGSPASSVDEDSPYGFTPTVTDPDDGDSHSFAISNKPAWASFDDQTGTLSGTPVNDDVGSYPDIVITVTDSAGASASLAAFAIEVVNSNDVPVLADLSLETEEDSEVAFQIDSDDDDGDAVTLVVVTAPNHGSLDSSGAQWRYVPDDNFHGSDSFVVRGEDGQGQSEPLTVAVMVTPVNDAPVAHDDELAPAYSADGSYLLDVLANDVDVDEEPLSILQANASLGQVAVEQGQLRLQLESGFTGQLELGYLIADAAGETDEGKVALTIGASDDDTRPTLEVPADVEAMATGLFTRVELGVAKAFDKDGNPLPVRLVRGHPLFRPGSHLVYWQTEDGAGNRATASQAVKVHPLVNFHKDQFAAEGNVVRVGVSLNGDAPDYPVTVPFSVAGSASAGSDYQSLPSELVISQGRSAWLEVVLLQDGVDEGDETLELSLDESVNGGRKASHAITIVERNLPPGLALGASQQGESRAVLARDGGQVVLAATVSDANAGDSHQYQWLHGYPELIDLDGEPATFTFDPVQLAPGRYQIRVTASDDGSPAESTSQSLGFRIVDTLAPLGQDDSDGDLLPDNLEGYGDDDGDGLANYEDAIDDCNLQPELAQVQDLYLGEGEPGICIRVGELALGGLHNGLWVDEEDPLPADEGMAFPSGTFDFIAQGLPSKGQQYRLVLPLRQAMPAGASYRKYSAASGWYDFVEDADNQLHSAMGEPGYCPPPGSDLWQPGLVAGAWCLQLTLTDGGPNDDDGLANHSISDPGGLAVASNGNGAPQAVDDQAELAMDQALVLDVLANDSDPDGDALTLLSVQAQLGQAAITADGLLSYRPPEGYLGDDEVSYVISDGQGGTATAKVLLSALFNNAPVASSDSVGTDDRTAIVVDVLANDSDPDGHALSLVSAQAQHGTASITTDNRLRYVPRAGFEGQDRVSYRLSDAFGAEATGTLLVQVDAWQELEVSNKGGGSLGWLALLPMALLALWRRKGLLLLALVSLGARADWVLGLQGGYSRVESQPGQWRSQAEAAGIEVENLGWDNHDWSWGLDLEYHFGNGWQAELGYQDLGDYHLEVRGRAQAPQASQAAIAAIGPMSAQGINLGLAYQWPLADRLWLRVQGGAWAWQADRDSDGVSGLKRDDEDVDPYYGLGLTLRLSSHWHLSAGWQRFELPDEPVDNGYLALKWYY